MNRVHIGFNTLYCAEQEGKEVQLYTQSIEHSENRRLIRDSYICPDFRRLYPLSYLQCGYGTNSPFMSYPKELVQLWWNQYSRNILTNSSPFINEEEIKSMDMSLVTMLFYSEYKLYAGLVTIPEHYDSGTLYNNLVSYNIVEEGA